MRHNIVVIPCTMHAVHAVIEKLDHVLRAIRQFQITSVSHKNDHCTRGRLHFVQISSCNIVVVTAVRLKQLITRSHRSDVLPGCPLSSSLHFL